MGGHRILLDCGLTDEAASGLTDEAAPADWVFCSHAHADHARGLAAFHQRFPQVPVYGSEVTAHLLPLNWPAEAREAVDFCHALPWRTPIEFAEGLSVQLWPAGHLPGAAAFLLSYATPQRTYTLFYTGDFFLSNSRLVEGMPIDELRGLKPDVLIIEGSYGTVRYPHRRQQENQLAERINQFLMANYAVLLPAPSVGLGQELLMLLRSHHHFTGRNINVWVEAKIAAGCDAYLELLSHFPSSVQNFARYQPLFWDERVLPRVRRLAAGELPDLSTPGIVLAHRDSDLSRYWQQRDRRWVAFIPENAPWNIAVTTRSDTGAIAAGTRRSGTRIEPYLLTSHCDRAGTTQLIHNLRPQHVIFVHGSHARLSELTNLEELQNRYQLHLPAAGSLVELPVGELFLQPAAPEAIHEGELSETVDEVMITLPLSVTADARWMQFADTGLVEARWQGDDLILKGISQQSVLQREPPNKGQLELDCCATCAYFKEQYCWNQASALFQFKVSPEGYCPAFEPQTDPPDKNASE
ncbi:MAG: MBL fold metallo-hydrolase [Leptolyngbyaceae cyanobacterium SM1_1_3]|nr:MBL fold metallo-hydrolase [Leptolyngbyaceae cyanobacterium SM1_1_3]NJN01945.1 MBL fold metallo-hydrolase [Leptolyngbyaceae cyanobacterium RM1_1_2]NJO10226.1 MBL fold metallo-hydrolase [Leptolyngbyaceae cyanobacterium SL_1_1]